MGLCVVAAVRGGAPLIDARRRQAAALDGKLNEPLHEAAAYVDAAVELLRHRDTVERSHTAAQDAKTKKEHERVQVEASEGKSGLAGLFSKKAPEVVKQEKLTKLDQQIEQVTKHAEEAEAALTQTNKDILEEFDAWNRAKFDDLHLILSDFVQSRIAYHQRSLQLLQELLPAVDSIKLAGTAASAQAD